MDDATLLNQFASDRSGEAFAALVRRHLNLVFFSALRQLGGNTALAEEVTQDVFNDLARKAGSLAGRESLAGWLHTSACFAAAKVRRTEARRLAREQEAQLMHEIHGTRDETASADWERIRPAIDDALHSLDERDREAVLLRFFEDRAWAEIGTTLRLSEEAARKRVKRALDRMARALASRGITSTGAALGVALGQQTGAAPPTGLASSVASVALAGVAMEAATAGAVGALSIMSTIKASAATAVVALARTASIGSNIYPSIPSYTQVDEVSLNT